METAKCKREKQYIKLRKKMHMLDIDQTYLGERLGVTQATISRKFGGVVPWKLDEVYEVLKIINEPSDRVYEFFPPIERTSA